MGNTFVKLYGEELEIVKLIFNKTNAEAEKILNDYISKKGLNVDLKSLHENGYVKYRYYPLVSKVGVVEIQPRCKNYFEMEKDYSKTSVSSVSFGTVSGSNIAIESKGNVNQFSVNVASGCDASKVIKEIRGLIPSLDDEYIENEIIDNVDQIELEIAKSSPDEGKLQRAIARINKILEPVAHLATVSTLLLHISGLWGLLKT